MTSDREEILQAIRAASRHNERPVGELRREADRLLEEIDSCRPSPFSSDVVASFADRISGPKVGASIDRIGSLWELPSAVARFLASKGKPAEVVLQPVAPLLGLDWAAAVVSLSRQLDEGVAVGLARWGIAETGSVVFHSAPDMPILHNFLCATHIVAVPARNIVRFLEDYAAAARISGDPAPRNACLVTGASGTTDIEGSLVKGAHGPRDLHIVIFDNDLQN